MILFFSFLYYTDALLQQIWYLVTLLVVICGFYALLTKTALKFFTKRSQTCALILMIITLPILFYAIFGIRIPQTTQYESYDVAMKCQDGTPVWFHIDWEFSAEGLFSAENPVHVHAVISRANISDLTKHLAAVSLTKAYFYGKNIMVGNAPSYGYVSLYSDNRGQYVADGFLIWHESETCYFVPIPPIPVGTVLTASELSNVELKGGVPELVISSASDTLAMRSNHIIEQLTFVAIAFTIIMLQPIISVLFPDVAKKETPTPPKTEPFYKRHQRKH